MNLVLRLFRCKRAVSVVEYAILLALIAMISISVIATLGTVTRNSLATVSCNGLHGDAAKDCSGAGNGRGGKH